MSTLLTRMMFSVAHLYPNYPKWSYIVWITTCHLISHDILHWYHFMHFPIISNLGACINMSTSFRLQVSGFRRLRAELTFDYVLVPGHPLGTPLGYRPTLRDLFRTFVGSWKSNLLSICWFIFINMLICFVFTSICLLESCSICWKLVWLGVKVLPHRHWRFGNRWPTMTVSSACPMLWTWRRKSKRCCVVQLAC